MLERYDPIGFYCEMLRCPETSGLRDRLGHLSIADFKRRAAAAEKALYDYGITFRVYSGPSAIDRILPFDAIPRVISAAEWRRIEAGVIQRVTALNLLLDDLYHGQRILKDGTLPAGLILGNVATENARVAESIALIRAEWQRMRDGGPSEAELRDAQTYLIGSFPLGLDSTRRIAGLLVRIQTERLGIDYLERRSGLIGGVTLEQARSVARRLFDPARLSFTVVGDPAGLETTRPARQPAH